MNEKAVEIVDKFKERMAVTEDPYDLLNKFMATCQRLRLAYLQHECSSDEIGEVLWNILYLLSPIEMKRQALSGKG